MSFGNYSTGFSFQQHSNGEIIAKLVQYGSHVGQQADVKYTLTDPYTGDDYVCVVYDDYTTNDDYIDFGYFPGGTLLYTVSMDDDMSDLDEQGNLFAYHNYILYFSEPK